MKATALMLVERLVDNPPRYEELRRVMVNVTANSRRITVTKGTYAKKAFSRADGSDLSEKPGDAQLLRYSLILDSLQFAAQQSKEGK